MTDPKSRYRDAERYTVPGPDGEPVTVAESPRRPVPTRRGVHLRRDGERLDHLAHHYLGDATAAWLICDLNDAMVPEALADVRSVDIPGEKP